jgi:hypothetical protein
MMKEQKNSLTPAQYWEWRTTIAEREIALQKLNVTQLEYKVLMRDAENLSIRTQLFLRTRMEAAKGAFEQARAEYERFKGVLENDLGQSLNNKVIDDITFEVKELPEEMKQQTSVEERTKE